MRGSEVRRLASRERKKAQQLCQAEILAVEKKCEETEQELIEEEEEELDRVRARYASHRVRLREETLEKQKIVIRNFNESVQSIDENASKSLSILWPGLLDLTSSDNMLELIWPSTRILLALKVCKTLRDRLLRLGADKALTVFIQGHCSSEYRSFAADPLSCKEELKRFGSGKMDIRLLGHKADLCIARALYDNLQDSVVWKGASHLLVTPKKTSFRSSINERIDQETMMKMVSGSPGLVDLCIANCWVSSFDFVQEAIQGCSGLAKIELSDVHFDVRFESLERRLATGLHLATLNNPHQFLPLQSLTLSGVNLGTESMDSLAKVLCRCTALTTLDISQNQIGCLGLWTLGSGFKVATKLSRLNLSSNRFRDSWWIVLAIRELKMLRDFAIDRNRMTDVELLEVSKALVSCKELQSLSLDPPILNSPHFSTEILPTMQCLESLSACNPSIMEAAPAGVITFFAQLPTLSLRRLDLSGNQIHPAMAETVSMGLSAASRLTSLNLATVMTTPESFLQLSLAILHLVDLKELDVRYSRGNADGWASFALALSHLSSLNRLDLGSCCIEGETWDTLRDMLPCSLTALDLSCNELNVDWLIKSLESCTRLSSINLSCMSVTDEMLRMILLPLRDHGQLTDLDLSDNDFCYSVIQIHDTLSGGEDPSSLRRIYFFNNNIFEAERRLLQESIPYCQFWF